MPLSKKIFAVSQPTAVFPVLLIVPLILTVILPSIFVFSIYFLPVDPDILKLLELIPQKAQLESLEHTLCGLILNYIFPVFFLMIPIMTASIMSASAFVGEKERHTLETLLYCPLTLQQIFQAKVLASFLLSMLVSLISFVSMLLVSPALSLIAVTLIVRGSAKAQSMEESQQAAIFLIIPLVLLVVGQFTGILLMSVWILLGLGIFCALLAWILLRKSMRHFTYEKLLL